jgi:4-diphosphocytidyl-2-C-methyl-D-erythritol kinase
LWAIGKLVGCGGLGLAARLGPMLTQIAYAKINLALHVRRRRDDGYHELETLFAFLDAGDRLWAREADGFSLEIEGPFGAGLSAGEDNLVLRAARLLARRHGIAGGVAFRLEKNLPIASGIGGGSADAAAALRLACALWGLDLGLAAEMALEIGADVPACLRSVTCFGAGVGEKLEPVEAGLAGAAVLLVNPLVACPTGPVFKAWDGVDRGALHVADWAAGRNDLQAPALALVPEIGAVLAALSQTGARVVRMSGSGATCFAVYDGAQERDAAAAWMAERYPDWWQLSGALR